jgi:hypothetical protein
VSKRQHPAKEGKEAKPEKKASRTPKRKVRPEKAAEVA